MTYTAGAQYFTTQLAVAGGILADQTTGIILQDISRVKDVTKPAIVALSWEKLPDGSLDVSKVEFISYQSINPETNELQGVVRGIDGFSKKAHNNGAVIAYVISVSHINALYEAVKAENLISQDEDNTLELGSDGLIKSVASGGGSDWIHLADSATLTNYREENSDKLIDLSLTIYQNMNAFISESMKLQFDITVDDVTTKYFAFFKEIDESSAVLKLEKEIDTSVIDVQITSLDYSAAESPYQFPSRFEYGGGSSGEECVFDSEGVLGPNLNLPNGLPTATQLDIDLSAYKMIRIVGTPYAGSTTNNTGHNNVLYLDLTHPPLGGYYKGGITIPYFSGGNGWDTTLVAEGKGFCFMALVNSTKSAFKYRVSLDKTVYTANDPSKVFQIWGIR